MKSSDFMIDRFITKIAAENKYKAMAETRLQKRLSAGTPETDNFVLADREAIAMHTAKVQELEKDLASVEESVRVESKLVLTKPECPWKSRNITYHVGRD